MNQEREIGGQAERTAMAWSRTLLAMAALCAFIAVSAERSGAPVAVVIALGAAVPALLLATSIVPRRVWSRAQGAVARTGAAARPLTNLLTAVLAWALGLIALLIGMLTYGGMR